MNKEKEKKLKILFFLYILLWQIVFNFILFPQRLFLKYPLNVLKFFSKLEPSERFLDFSPFYLFFNGFFSIFSKESYKLIPYFQIFLSLVSLYFLFNWIEKKFSPSIAYITIAFSSLYPSYLLYLNCLEPESLLASFIIIGIVMLLKEKPSFLTGLFFTIAFLLRPSFLPLALIAFFFIKNKRIFYFVPIVSGILILLFFSYWATGYFTLTFMSPGTVFYEGNNPQATGVASIYPKTIKIWEGEFKPKEADYAHRLYKKISEFEEGKKNSLMENQFFWFKKALNYIIDFPVLWFSLFFKKILFYLSAGEAHDIFSLIIINNKLGFFKFFSFAIFSSFALMGLIFQFKKIHPLIIILFLLNILLLSLFYFSSRQRITLFSICIFFIPYGIEFLIKRKFYIFLFAFFLIIFSIKLPDLKSFDETFKETQEAGFLREVAGKFLEEKEFIEASRYLSLSIAIAPYLSYLHSSCYLQFYNGTPYSQGLNIKKDINDFNRGLLLFYDQNYREALGSFEKIKFKKIQKHYYNQDLPIYYYIISLFNEKKEEEGKKYLKIAKEKYPAYLSLKTLDFLINGKNDLTRYYDILHVNFKLMETAFFLKDYEKSLKYSKEVIKIAPEILYAHEISSISNAYLGNFQEMAKELKFIVTKKNLIVFHRQWQDITKKLEEKFGKDKVYQEFINYLRTLFPKY